MKKLNNKKGFTLMEMLIVVAIIAILIAIAIPTFSNSLNSAKKAADEANVRSAYAEAMQKYLLDTDTGATARTVNTMQTSDGISVQTSSGSSTWTVEKGKYVQVSVSGGVVTYSNVQ